MVIPVSIGPVEADAFFLGQVFDSHTFVLIDTDGAVSPSGQAAIAGDFKIGTKKVMESQVLDDGIQHVSKRSRHQDQGVAGVLVFSNPLQDVGCNVWLQVRVVEFFSAVFQWPDVPVFVEREHGTSHLCIGYPVALVKEIGYGNLQQERQSDFFDFVEVFESDPAAFHIDECFVKIEKSAYLFARVSWVHWVILVVINMDTPFGANGT